MDNFRPRSRGVGVGRLFFIRNFASTGCTTLDRAKCPQSQHMDRVQNLNQGNSSVRNKEATPFPQAGEGCFPPLVAMNFKDTHIGNTNVCVADAGVTRSSIKSTPRRSPRLNEGTQHRQVRFEPKMTTPRQTTKSIFEIESIHLLLHRRPILEWLHNQVGVQP